MKKLLIATDCFLPRWDGVTRFLIEILPYLKAKYHITIIAPEFEGIFHQIEGVETIRLPTMKMSFGDIQFSWFHYRKIKHLVREHDIIFSQTIGPIGISAIKAGKKHKKPVIAFIHSIDWELTTKSIDKFKSIIHAGTKFLARRMYNKCNLLIVPFDEVGDLLRKNGIKTPYTTVHLGTNLQRFMPPENKEHAKELLDLPKEAIIIGFHGRFGREKDLITLYRAFRKLEKKYNKIKLLLIGKGVKSIERMFTSERNIILPGSTNNVIPYLQAMDIYVLPSLTETTSLSTLEAMACCLPVIVTPVGYVKQYVKEKENGMFFPFRNSLVLAMKLEMLINNPKLREALGRNGRRAVERYFSWEKTANGIMKVLQQF
ncbi:glycosyltransferase family 4 protein [Candidatus Woesearchaeota archaeon]|nr:glycosyltransferase family 4 protein [Candidatus Woesearchaeota archaeon]